MKHNEKAVAMRPYFFVIIYILGANKTRLRIKPGVVYM